MGLACLSHPDPLESLAVSSKGYTLLDRRLYLPEREWAGAPQ